MGGKTDILDSLTLELRRGTIVLSVLSQLDTPKYGYALVQSMEKRGAGIEPGTLYPLLRRLEKQGLLVSDGKPRAPNPANITAERRLATASICGCANSGSSLCRTWSNC